MADDSFKVKNSLNIQPIAGATPSAEGDIVYDDTANSIKYNNGSTRTVVNTDEAQTLTNKTIVATNNTITTASSGNLTSVELNAALAELQGDIDTTNSNNTGDVTLGAVGSSPNANGASLSGQALTLQPASASYPGVVTTGTQTFAGAKTFSGSINFAATFELETSVSSTSNAMTIDASLGNNFYTSMTEDTTLTINNMTTGQTIMLIATGHASNAYTITFPTMKKRTDFTGSVAATKYNVYVITNRGGTLFATVVEDMA